MAEVVKSLSIENLVNQRCAAVERVLTALQLIQEVENIAAGAQLGFPRLVIDNHYIARGHPIAFTGDYWCFDEAKQTMISTIDAQGWHYLLNESGLLMFMDSTARKQWDDQLRSGDVPELTRDTVKATFAQLYGAREDMFEHGVLECFRRLSWHYKTNQPFKFGKRIIVTRLVTGGYPNQSKTNDLDDLVRVFYVLDGKPQPDHRDGLHHQLTEAKKHRSDSCQNDYLSVKWYKNGNGHVTFLRPDLVDQLNRIMAKRFPQALAADRP